jgi:hypothetical protein
VGEWKREKEREREVMIMSPKALGKISLHIFGGHHISTNIPPRKEEDLMHTP